MMNKRIKTVFIVFILASITACQSHSSGLLAEDRLMIETSSKTWVKTYNQNDWKSLALLFSVNGTMMPPNSPEVRGHEAIATWQNENESGFRIAFDVQEIDGIGDIAFVKGRSCVFIPDGEDAFLVDVGKFLEVRKKQSDGTWLIYADVFNSDAALGSQLLESCPFVANP
ncbi:MAG: ketosteroid isomerase-like protein [Paraglaciecola sp.]|jgi:ketosteroid isomerase-like protein